MLYLQLFNLNSYNELSEQLGSDSKEYPCEKIN